MKEIIQKDLKKSGLDLEELRNYGVEIFTGNSKILEERLGYTSHGGYPILQVCELLEFKYLDSQRKYIFSRFHMYPPLNGTKYLHPYNAPARPYILPQVWEVMNKPNKPLWLTEEEKKALRLLKEGRFAIAISGVWNFKERENNDNVNLAEIWGDLLKFNLQGRTVFMAFDMDLWGDPSVRKILYELAFRLYKRDAIVKFVKWDIQKGKGIDEFLTNSSNPAETLLNLESTAKSLEDFVEKEHYLDIVRAIGVAELPEDKEEMIIKPLAKKFGLKIKTFESMIKKAKTLIVNTQKLKANENDEVDQVFLEELQGNITQEQLKNLGYQDQQIITKEEVEEYKRKFPEIFSNELADILSLTIKQDRTNKVITFLCFLSAYTENSQFNISFNAPSSTGKSYIPLEIASLFPKEDIIKTGYCSPTAFFHDKGEFLKEIGGYVIDLERKVLIFLDQPHTQLLERLRPLLSHDEKEITIKITDKSEKKGLRTKNVLIKGFPAVIFCSAGLKIDEQEATRFILLSPETTEEKIKEGIDEVIEREADYQAYLEKLNSSPERQLLIERILTIKKFKIKEIKISEENKEIIKNNFLSSCKPYQPRHQRDIKRLISIIKTIALLNLWHRDYQEGCIYVSKKDIEEGFKLWDEINISQEYNLPPYVYKVFKEVIVPLWEEKKEGLERKEISQGYLKKYNRPIGEWRLRREILPMLQEAGLIVQEPDPTDKRKILIFLGNQKEKNDLPSDIEEMGRSDSMENNCDKMVGEEIITTGGWGRNEKEVNDDTKINSSNCN